MVDELTQESFQTGKAIVTVSVDLITAIADVCKRSEQQNPGMSEEQKEMTETLVLYDDKGKEVMSADFVNNGEINMDDVRNFKIVVVIVTAVQSLT